MSNKMPGKKTIVFIESYPTVMLYKISKLLKEKGYETVLIRIVRPNQSDIDFYSSAYDKIIDLDILYYNLDKRNIPKIIISMLKQIKPLLKGFFSIIRLKPYVILGRGTLNLPIALFRIWFNDKPFIYFPYDIRSQYAPTKEIAKKEYNIPGFEIWAERYCFEHADGIIHKGDPEELNFLENRMLGNNIKLPSRILHFLPYCSKDFIIPFNKNKISKGNKELHFVLVAASGRPSVEMFEKELKKFITFVNNKIHVHIYRGVNVSDNDNKSIEEFYNLHKNDRYIKYFHIEEPLDPKLVIREISKYDYGLWPPFKDSDFPEYYLEQRFAMGNKFSSYLEAGIPFFYSFHLKYVDKLMKDYDLDFSLKLDTESDLKHFLNKLKKLDLKVLKKKIEFARNDFLMEKNINKLEDFINLVAKEKY